jgi:N-acetylglucosaminyldiphosphoundecaprenol N-acetyl-beta-D-mannosaminyltransferase
MSDLEILGYRVSGAGLEKVVATVHGWIESGVRGRYFACLNPHSVAVASRDPLFRESLQAADLLVVDGAGVLLAAKLFGVPIPRRITGSDLFAALTAAASWRPGTRFFFLGSNAEVLDRIGKRMRREFPSIVVCGSYAPPYADSFSEGETLRMVEAVNTARPDVLWVGMTAPKQEKWIFRNRERLMAPCIGAVGAVFDFYAGTKRRSPAIWRKLGLEWLHRFFQEPARMWRRNFVSTPRFLGIVMRELLRLKMRLGRNRQAGETKLRRR